MYISLYFLFSLNGENIISYVYTRACSLSRPSRLLWVNIWWGRSDSSWNRGRQLHLATLCESSTSITPHFTARGSEVGISLTVAVVMQLWVCRMHATSLQRTNLFIYLFLSVIWNADLSLTLTSAAAAWPTHTGFPPPVAQTAHKLIHECSRTKAALAFKMTDWTERGGGDKI